MAVIGNATSTQSCWSHRVPGDTEDKSDEIGLLIGRVKSAAAPMREILRDLHSRYAGLDDGTVANYIPELAKVDPKSFGISIVSVDGTAFDIGDHDKSFTIQSISKPFMYGLALEDHGLEHVLSKIGVEPTGEAFNAIVLDEVSNRPFNPMVNAGAIATADLIEGKDFPERISRTLAMLSRYCGRDVHIDNSVFLSERQTGHRNRAIAHLMLNFGMMSDRMPDSLELYFQQCSVLVNCHDLAMMGATLANDGINPVTGELAISKKYVKHLLSIMLTCGMYDYAGEWAFRVGMPAKSGVGGGIVAVVPGQCGIGIFSPRLDSKGNSARGIKVCQELSERFGLHCFDSKANGPTLREQFSPGRPHR
jgi:glutaminase